VWTVGPSPLSAGAAVLWAKASNVAASPGAGVAVAAAVGSLSTATPDAGPPSHQYRIARTTAAETTILSKRKGSIRRNDMIHSQVNAALERTRVGFSPIVPF
jgi:hypothetical protein